MLVMDLECDGFYDTVSQIHCICIYDTDTDQMMRYNDVGSQEPVVRAVQILETADVVAGHNLINFDYRVIKKIYDWFNPQGVVIDTLLLSRLYHANIMDVDRKRKWTQMPAQQYGRHGLESWGYRLNEYKGEFAKETDWKEWSLQMEDYCEQDVKVTTKLLCEHFPKYLIG